jgi:hypothetical protein
VDARISPDGLLAKLRTARRMRAVDKNEIDDLVRDSTNQFNGRIKGTGKCHPRGLGENLRDTDSEQRNVIDDPNANRRGELTHERIMSRQCGGLFTSAAWNR